MDQRRERLNQLKSIMEFNKHNKYIVYYKAFIEFYQVYYQCDLDRAYNIVFNDIGLSAKQKEIDLLVNAKFELADEQNINLKTL